MRESVDQLRERLRGMNGRSYGAYKRLRGSHAFEGFTLHVDHVQGDPFAAPSRLRVTVPVSTSGLPEALHATPGRAVALRDFLARRFTEACDAAARRAGSGKSGLLAMARPGQEILARSSIVLPPDAVEARFTAGLPAAGRRILGREAAVLLCDAVPRVVDAALVYARLDAAALDAHVHAVEDAAALREAVETRGWVAFVADGAVLPRRSGADDRPMTGPGVQRFAAPPSLRATVPTPHAGDVTGMAVPRGVTLIVGGGYHGKSTLLRAIEQGVYDHVPGDGRDRVVALPDAVEIRAEDGRPVAGVDLRPFIDGLPGGVDAARFCTGNASGSTSQAANLMEALEIGTRLLLLDEDTCATNLMIRDARMQRLVERAGEPITPYIDRVRALADDRGVSSLLVLGGCGDYFDVADTVIRMRDYRPVDVSAAARAVAAELPGARAAVDVTPWPAAGAPRRIDPASMDPRRGRRASRVRAHRLRAIEYGHAEIDLAQVEQLVDPAQVRALGAALERVRAAAARPGAGTLAELVRAVAQEVADDGLDVLRDAPGDDHAQFRAHELAAALNRLRGLRGV